ncbi:hypothetical protein [Natronobeatus ordinarius]|uniref:hypothetical protein n=1 Tax=Natronobeatus ordinarius TaxID=2963433 RepID=UPI0020CD4884|nr:hypothetical protein [Natronobeatus ordinarius]
MDDSRTVHWRRDASTSRTVRVLWALGVGTFLAAIALIVFGRFYGLTAETGGQSIVVATLAAAAVAIVAVVLAGQADDRLERLGRYVPFWTPSGGSFRQALDAAAGAVVMGAIIFALVLFVGPGIGFGLATATIPFAVVLIMLSSFLQSVGALDLEEGRLYLYEPEVSVDLDLIEDVSVRHVGDAAMVKLAYEQPNGQYVQGPRRLVVPPGIARELQAIVRS